MKNIHYDSLHKHLFVLFTLFFLLVGTQNGYAQGQIASIDVTPDDVTLQVGQQQLFTATGEDAQGNTVPIPNPSWEVSGGGAISPNGSTCTFLAGSQAGTFTITCREAGTSIQGSSTINIIDPTSVDSDPDVPTRFSLAQNYPNPFNPVTTIEFSVKATSHVLLRITDLRGRLVAILANGVHQPGVYKINFDARDLVTGVYLYQIQMRDFRLTRKMVLLR